MTKHLESSIETKDKELSRLRNIHQIRLNQTKGTTSTSANWVPNKTKKKSDKGVQTVINGSNNQVEYETFSYLYDKDQNLISTEKSALLKYMRKEVVQNEEFLQRIRELEWELNDRDNERDRYRLDIARAQQIIRGLEDIIRD